MAMLNAVPHVRNVLRYSISFLYVIRVWRPNLNAIL